MNEQQYSRLSEPFRSDPRALKAFTVVNATLKIACYVLYPVLLATVWFNAPSLLPYEILVPAVLFIAVSVFRHVYDAPRPYEVLEIEPLIKRAKTGRSFPSRHVFSIFMIAMCWLRYSTWVGIVLLACGIVLAWARVVGGVHHPKDVVAGALIAVLGGVLGLWILPLA